MQKWEYLFIALEWAAGSVMRGEIGEWRVKFINGKQQNDWNKGPSLYEFCAARGDEGWEMVTVSNSPVFDSRGVVKEEYYRVIFKRPKE